MPTALKLAAAVVLYCVMYAMVPDFQNRVWDGLVPIMLAACAIIIVFWLPLPRRRLSHTGTEKPADNTQ